MASIIVLKSAQQDFDEIKAGFKRSHSTEVFDSFKVAFRRFFENLKQYPKSGVVIEQAQVMGLEIRQALCVGVRVFYSYDQGTDTIIVRMFLPTQRDFLTHLTTRILRPPQ